MAHPYLCMFYLFHKIEFGGVGDSAIYVQVEVSSWYIKQTPMYCWLRSVI